MHQHLQDSHPINALKPEKGTYALLLRSDMAIKVQVGRWSQIEVQPGYYLYVGSAFGPGGVRARVSRHFRADKPKRWHIDYLREFADPLEVWTSYEPKRLEHFWAIFLYDSREITPIMGFGCSDCQCFTHLFYCPTSPDLSTFSVRFDSLSHSWFA